MNHGYIVERCKYHNGRTYSRKKCDCNSCTLAIRQAKLSDDLRAGHINGKFCKKSNNCPKCCETRWKIRMVHHIGFNGRECGRKCETCKGQICSQVFRHMYESMPYMLYRIMLPKKRR